MFGLAGDLLSVKLWESYIPGNPAILGVPSCLVTRILSSNVDGSGFPASPWLKDPMLVALNWLYASCNKKEAI